MNYEFLHVIIVKSNATFQLDKYTTMFYGHLLHIVNLHL